MTKSRWQPLLRGALAAQAHERCEVLLKGLFARLEKGDLITLDASGIAELALLRAYLSRAGADEDHAAYAVSLLAQAVDRLAQTPTPAWLHGGFTGVAWVAAHLCSTFPEFGCLFEFDAIDEVLLERLNDPTWCLKYDLIDGVIGVGTYFLERLPDTSAKEGLERVVNCLEKSGEGGPDGFCWLTHPSTLSSAGRQLCPDGYYALGVAHGIAGIISLLGEVWQAGIARQRVGCLIDGGVSWLLKQLNGLEFPSTVRVGASEPPRHFFSWCWGSLGTSAALLVAARATQHREWEQVALDVASALAKQRDIPTDSACLCHGTGGHAHVFNRMFQATGNAELRQAAEFWYERTLWLPRVEEGIGGFRVPDNQHLAMGFLFGAVGIALSLAAATSDVEPAWDRLMLISHTPRAEMATKP